MKWSESRRGEYVCEHGVGHPSMKRTLSIAKIQCIPKDKIIDQTFCKHMLDICSTHGCDGCCSRDDFPGKTNSLDYEDAVLTLMNYYKNHKNGVN